MSLEVLGIAVKYWVVFGTGFVAGVWVGYKLSKAPVVDGVWLEAIEQSQKEIAEKDARIAELEARLNVDFPLLVKLFDNIDELKAREKELVEALESIIESGLLNGSYKLHTKIDKIAREALATVRGE